MARGFDGDDEDDAEIPFGRRHNDLPGPPEDRVGEMLTMDEFLQRAPTTLAAFAEATKRYHSQGFDSMNPNKPMHESWWWREVAAYLNFCDNDEDQKRKG